MKAPGREKTTALFPLKQSSLVTSFQSKGFSSSDSIRVRVLKVTLGTASPSLTGVECSARLGLEREVEGIFVENRVLLAKFVVKAAAEEINEAAVKRVHFIVTSLFIILAFVRKDLMDLRAKARDQKKK